MLVIGISGKRQQGKSKVAIALASRLERCTIVSVYDIIKFFNDYKSDDERDAIVEKVRQVCESYLVDTLKLKMSLESNKYDVFIIDDIFDSVLMNQIKTELNAQIIGVENTSLHNLPLKIRDNVASGLLGEPDYVVKYSSNYNELSIEIDKLINVFKGKGILAG